MIARAALISFLSVVALVVLVAQGTDTERADCRTDAKRICKSVLGDGVMAVASCLNANKAKLSPRCRDVMTSHGF